jgi:hypothetical protein
VLHGIYSIAQCFTEAMGEGIRQIMKIPIKNLDHGLMAMPVDVPMDLVGPQKQPVANDDA